MNQRTTPVCAGDSQISIRCSTLFKATQSMGFPSSEQAEDQDVLHAVEELAFADARDSTQDAQGQPLLIKDLRRLS